MAARPAAIVINRRSPSVPPESSDDLPGVLPSHEGSALAWHPSLASVLGWAVLVGLAMSAQMLFQPFVWRNWPWDEVVAAWARQAALRVAVSLVIALALSCAWRVPARSAAARAGRLMSAIALGATAAEGALAHWGLGSERALWQRFVQWNVVAGSVTGMFYLWRRGSDARDAAHAFALQQAERERQRIAVRLQALRSQIEPHFLFNTLATLRSLQRNDAGQSAQLVAYLLDYLRAAGTDVVRDGTLAEELARVRGYLGVVGVRMAGRLAVDIDVDETLLGCEMPALIVATLVENSVKHGLAPVPAGGRLSVRAQRSGDRLEVSVSDTGGGFGGGVSGSGFGLANVKARLHTLYGAHGSLELRENKPHGVTATLWLPHRLVGARA